MYNVDAVLKLTAVFLYLLDLLTQEHEMQLSANFFIRHARNSGTRGEVSCFISESSYKSSISNIAYRCIKMIQLVEEEHRKSFSVAVHIPSCAYQTNNRAV